MNFLHTLKEEFINFSGIGALLKMYQTGDYHSLLTLHGVLGAISPVIPLLLFIEIIRALVYKRFRIEDYRMPFFVFVANRFISRFLSIAAVAFCISLLEKHAVFTSRFT